MLLISEELQFKYLGLNDRLKLVETLNNKVFRVADSPLSYRQTNALAMDRLMPDNREKKEGWRKFSLKELIYISIVYELKKYGLKHVQLKYLWECFFKEPDLQKKEYQITKAIAETAIGCVFTQVEIVMTITSKGEVIFYDPVYFTKTEPNDVSFIFIRLNDVVNGLLKKVGKTLPVSITISDAYFHRRATPKEQEVLKIIRNRAYTSIKIKKKNGELLTVNAVTLNTDISTHEDILKRLKESDYQEMSIVQRGGAVVNLTIEETIKL